MTSLTDVYEGRVGRVASRRQQLLGTGLFLAGVAMLVGAIAIATTGVGYRALGEWPARELGGILAGIGLQAVILGVFAVLPASHRVRAAALIASGITVLGVALFRYAYPYEWVESAPLFALATTVVYFFGVATTLWCLFVALATFKTRSDPGGTARMEITEEGTIRLVEEARPSTGFGGIGLFGAEPDGTVETQTNVGSAAGGPGGTTAVSDGGSTTTRSISEVTADTDARRDATVGGGTTSGPTDGHASRGQPDRYCGNCRYFEYVTADGEPVPYCGYHGEAMDDMDACSAWGEQSR